MAAAFTLLRESVLLAEDRRRVRNWWRRLDLWDEMVAVAKADFARVDVLAQRGWKLTASMRIRRGQYKRWMNSADRRLRIIAEEMAEIRRRQGILYGMVKQAEVARRRGVVMLDAQELRRLGKKAVAVDKARGGPMNKARWGEKRAEAEAKKAAKIAAKRAARENGTGL